MIDLVQLHHVSFATTDLEASKRFFGGVIGLPEIERPGFGFAGAWYAIGDRQRHLIQEQGPGPEAKERISRSDHMALEVRDVQAVKKALNDHGVVFTSGGNQALGMDQVFCRDPDGHVIEFVQYRTS